MEDAASINPITTQAEPQPQLWVLEARGSNPKDILDRARILLGNSDSITLVDEPGYYNGVLFYKYDNVAHIIDPKDEKWGYTVEEGQVITLEVIGKNEKKKKRKKKQGKNEKKGDKKQKVA